MQLDEWLCIGIPEEVLEQASAWLARLDADHVSLAERQLLSRWLDEDPTHRWAFDELSQLFARTATLSQVRNQVKAPRVLLFPQPTASVTEPVATTPAPMLEGTSANDAPPAPRHWQSVVAILLIVTGITLSLSHTPSGSTPPSLGAPNPGIQSFISAD